MITRRGRPGLAFFYSPIVVMMTPASSRLINPKVAMPDLRQIRHIALDMDGTIYLGKRLFAETLPFLASLKRIGIGHSYITNNCSRSRSEYVHHLNEIGIDAPADSIQTSAHATAHYLATN